MKRTTWLLLTCGALALGCTDPPAEATTGDDDTTDGPSGTTTAGVTLTSPTATSPATSDPSTSSATEDPSDTESSTGVAIDTTTGGEGNTTIAEGSTTVGATTGATLDDTIYEVQDGTIAEGEDVVVDEVIITALLDGEGLFAQEPGGGQYSGVLVDTGVEDLTVFSIGDEINVTGVTSEGSGGFAGMTVIDASAGTIMATGETGLEPAAEQVPITDFGAPATAEPWEGVLVVVDEGALLRVVNEPGFDEFDVALVTDEVRVDNFLYSVYDNPGAFPNFGVNAGFGTVTGPLNFSFDAFKIAPRSDADLTGYVEPAM